MAAWAAARGALYVLALYAWWNVCAHYFGMPAHGPHADARARAHAPDHPHRESERGALAAAGANVTPSASSCPGRRPFHTLLTGQGTVYNQWQARIMYYHWKKQAAAGGPCTDMTGFTRLCASKGGLPDGVEKYIPSVFVPQLTTEVLAKYGHFGVLNRPHSVVEFFKNPELKKRIKEEYVRAEIGCPA